MNINLEEQLSKALEKAIGIAEKTGEFALEIAPELLKEFYAWHLTENIIKLVLSVIWFVFLRWIISKAGIGEDPESEYSSGYEKISGKYYSHEFLIIGGIFGLSVSIFVALTFVSSLNDVLQIVIAPKIYLIEYFMN